MPRCESVVRFNAPATGRERVQLRGRARQQGSEFVHILDWRGEERRLHDRARAEEDNLKAVLRGFPALRI